jgi:SHS2 domain-containing protein
MRVTGKTLEELFRDALLGMVAAMKPVSSSKPSLVKRPVVVEAPDATSLLIDFLGEALVWTHTKREAYVAVRFRTLTESALEAELEGYVAGAFGEDIKAVTYHEAEVKRNAAGVWATTIIFDV